MLIRPLSVLAFPVLLSAEAICPNASQYTPCDTVFSAPATVEFRSPRNDTALVRAFSDGPSKWVVRFTPYESGAYAYKAIDGPEGQFTVAPVPRTAPGILHAANVHHFAFADGSRLSPHLWMGVVVPNFDSMEPAAWRKLIDARAEQHFNHASVTLVDESAAANFNTPDFFHGVEAKISYANQHGVIVDVAFFGPNGLLKRLLPEREQRQKWFQMAVSRLAPYEVTWQGLEAWETYDDARELLKEIAGYLSDYDPYRHPRSTRTLDSSGPFVDDGWLQYRSYQTGDNAVQAIDQQVFQYPAVNNFSSGVTDAETFRHRLWNAAMNGDYPAPEVPDEAAANFMKIWYEFMSESRHWETEPFFDVDGGRGLALEGTEYLIYVEKPGPVTVRIEDHRYDAAWFNPLTGQWTKIKEVKGATFAGEPPDRSHDWVLRISREARKASMLKSVFFDSREGGIVLQTVEGNPEKVPFQVVEPAADTIRNGARFSVKLTRRSKAIDQMMYQWTGEVTADNRSYRVIGTGAEGMLAIPQDIAARWPAALHVRITGINGLGKVYVLDRNYQLTR